jgi:hypothetical protein
MADVEKFEEMGTVEKMWDTTSGKGKSIVINTVRYFLSKNKEGNYPDFFKDIKLDDLVKFTYTRGGADGSLLAIHDMSLASGEDIDRLHPDSPQNKKPETNLGTTPEEVNEGKPPEKSLAIAKPQSIAPQAEVVDSGFTQMLAQADVLLKSGLLPTEIKTPAAALAIILTGKELGVPMMQSLRGINIIKGKPVLFASLMGALIFKDGHKYIVKESTDKSCTIDFIRKGEQPVPYTFTLDDAAKAGLTGKDVWKQYPKAMLFSRCMSAGAKMVMPDLFTGAYTPEELAKSVKVDESGDQIVVEGE